MPSSVDDLEVAGINWLTAMESATRMLERVDSYSTRKIGPPAETISAYSSVAQAWIALAREITMHARVQ